jgi:Ca2+-binding EF-hand superfamily protein
MTIKHFAIAAATACLFSFGSVSADDSSRNNGVKPQKISAAASPFTTLDRNGDHRISRSEAGFDRVMSETFAVVDTDGDGFVSTAEFAAADKTRNTVSSNLPGQ